MKEQHLFRLPVNVPACRCRENSHDRRWVTSKALLHAKMQTRAGTRICV